MQDLYNFWISEWQKYDVDPWYTAIAMLVIVVAGYRDLGKTMIVVWSVVYGWTLVVTLQSEAFNLNAGFNVVWFAGYALCGFFLLGVLIYQNLKG